MKKVALSLVLAASVAIAFGQTQKGAFTLSLHNFSPHLSQASSLLAPTNAFGISFGNTVSETGNTKSEYSYTTLGFNCSAQYFIINNLSAGPDVNIFFQGLKEKGSGGDSYNTNIAIGGLEYATTSMEAQNPNTGSAAAVPGVRHKPKLTAKKMKALPKSAALLSQQVYPISLWSVFLSIWA